MKHKIYFLFLFATLSVPVISSPVKNVPPAEKSESKSAPKVETVVEIVRKSPKQDEGAETGQVSGLLGLFAASLEDVIPGDTGETVSGYLQGASAPIQAFFEQPVKQIADYLVSTFTSPPPPKLVATTPKPTQAPTAAPSVIYVINNPKPAGSTNTQGFANTQVLTNNQGFSNIQGASYSQAASNAANINSGNFNQAGSPISSNNYYPNLGGFNNAQGNYNQQSGNFNQGGFQNTQGNYQQSNINNPAGSNQQSFNQNSGGFVNTQGNYQQSNINNPVGNKQQSVSQNSGGFSNSGGGGNYNQQGGFPNSGASGNNNFNNNNAGNTAGGNYNQGGFKNTPAVSNNNFNNNPGNTFTGNYNNGVQNTGGKYNQGGFPNAQSQGNYNQQGVIGNYNNNQGGLSNSATNNNFGINEPSNSGQAIYKYQESQNQGQSSGPYKIRPNQRIPVSNLASSNVITPPHVPADYDEDVEKPQINKAPGIYQLDGDPNNRRKPILPNTPIAQINPKVEDDELDANKPIANLNQKIVNRFSPSNQQQLGPNVVQPDPAFFNNGDQQSFNNAIEPQNHQQFENFNNNQFQNANNQFQNANNQFQQNYNQIQPSNNQGNLNYFNPGPGQRQKVSVQQQPTGANLGAVGRPGAQVQIFAIPGPAESNAPVAAVTEAAPVASTTDEDDDDAEETTEEGEAASASAT